MPADYNAFKKLVDEFEPGASEQLEKYLREAAFKYEVGIKKLIHKPGLSLTEFIDW